MNIDRKSALLHRYAGAVNFVSSSTSLDFVYGLADYFAYQFPHDFYALSEKERKLLALSFYMKEFWSSGIDAAIERLGLYWPYISSGLQEFGGEKTQNLANKLNSMLRDNSVDILNEDAAYAFVESNHFFVAETMQIAHEVHILLGNMRASLLTMILQNNNRG